jgi:hypothetical protein
MARRIEQVIMPEDPVEAGKEFQVTVHYTADQDGEMAISYRGSFDGDPDRVLLPAGSTKQRFEMVIVRYGTAPSCQVELRFGNIWDELVEVTG